MKHKARLTSTHQNCKKVIGFLCMLFICLNVFSQQEDSTKRSDSVRTFNEDITNQIKQIGTTEASRNTQKFAEDLYETKQEELIEQIKATTLAASNYIKFGIDTAGLGEELSKIENWYNIAIDGILTNKGTAQTNRNLQTSKKILKELLARTSSRKTDLDKYYKKLRDYRNTIDSLNSDTVLYKFSSDSAVTLWYLKKLMLLSSEIGPADTAFKHALTNAASLQAKLNATVNQLSSGIDEIEIFQKDLYHRIYNREFANITGPVGYMRPFDQIISISYKKGILAFYFYCINNSSRIVLLVLLIIGCTFFLRSLKKHLKEDDKLSGDFSTQLILRYPALSSILLILSIFQFIFPDPVFIFNAIIWTLSGVCLTIIFRGYITKYWMRSWLALFSLFIIACADNFILQASRTERWFMLLLSIAGIVACCLILLRGRQKELKEKWIIYFIWLVCIVEFVAMVANIYGRYNLSKTLLTTGFFNVVIGILFLWTMRLINQLLSLAFDVYKTPEKKSFYINFKKLGNRVPNIFYVVMIIGWSILLGRNFYAFRNISDPIHDFLREERSIGNFTFSVESIFLFFSILVLSTLLSRIVSFFATDSTTSGKRGLGSWLLIIRISITTIGLLLAFAAAGIPTDKITIIISALGVGIGFGLQTLINNLVSGLIISFEKPVNVGDIIEIGIHSGVMKSIGFRSSIIYTWDGADVIIPNGELLNQHLVNWTLANTNRRVDIMIGVAYGTDLEVAQQILKQLVSNDERIMDSPPPSVIAEKFNASSIDLKLLFWVKNVREWTTVKSDVLLAINTAFKENNISIPFPQQDVYIHATKADKE